tara:strand:- start:891 stop:1613 length:723 start_codon:yes stop_codon:yes gene_type:complete
VGCFAKKANTSRKFVPQTSFTSKKKVCNFYERRARTRMAPVVWLENVWIRSGADNRWPESKLVAQTTLGPAEAACAFAAAFLLEPDAHLVQDVVMQRKGERKGQFLTFRAEFLRVAAMLDACLLLLVVGQGGVVRSVELCESGAQARVVDEAGAQGALDAGALVVAIDFESSRTVKAYSWNGCWAPLKLLANPEAPHSHLPTPPPAPAALSVAAEACGVREQTADRIARAKRATLNSELW